MGGAALEQPAEMRVELQTDPVDEPLRTGPHRREPSAGDHGQMGGGDLLRGGVVPRTPRRLT